MENRDARGVHRRNTSESQVDLPSQSLSEASVLQGPSYTLHGARRGAHLSYSGGHDVMSGVEVLVDQPNRIKLEAAISMETGYAKVCGQLWK